MNLRYAISCLAIMVPIAFFHVSSAAAFEQRAFEAAAFKAAQDAGKPIVVHVTAPWCPTCVAQHTALDSLAAKPEFQAITLYQIDFDSQPDAWKSVGARSQSTLVAYAGAEETGRLVGVTKAEPIADLINSSLAK